MSFAAEIQRKPQLFQRLSASGDSLRLMRVVCVVMKWLIGERLSRLRTYDDTQQLEDILRCRCVRPRRPLQRIMAIGKGWTRNITIGIYSKETFVDKLAKIEVRRLLSQP